MKTLVLLSLFCYICSAQEKIYHHILNTTLPYFLPDLPFSYNGLEPYLDEATLIVHHTGHHKAYTSNMNKALKEWRAEDMGSQLAYASIANILERINEVPSQYQTTLRNHGGGYVNHIFYWATLCPPEMSEVPPGGDLLADIEKTFGSYEELISLFVAQAKTLFGSGYVWLVEDVEGVLSVEASVNQDSPLSNGHYPLLVIDVWEHAYYLKHQNKRADYVGNWLNITCWKEVEQLRQFWWEAGKVREKRDKSEL